MVRMLSLFQVKLCILYSWWVRWVFQFKYKTLCKEHVLDALADAIFSHRQIFLSHSCIFQVSKCCSGLCIDLLHKVTAPIFFQISFREMQFELIMKNIAIWANYWNHQFESDLGFTYELTRVEDPKFGTFEVLPTSCHLVIIPTRQHRHCVILPTLALIDTCVS